MQEQPPTPRPRNPEIPSVMESRKERRNVITWVRMVLAMGIERWVGGKRDGG